jgi:hypothetical protein
MKPADRIIGLLAMPLACGSFILAALGMVHGLEPFHTWFYVFSWWSYILFLEGFLHGTGARSQLFTETGRFLLQLPLSVSIWLIFEVFNFRLQNWHYVQVPSNASVRWFGYAISFATVLPGINATAGLLRALGLVPSVRWPSFALSVASRRLVVGTGLVSLILPVLWPQFFFPLVWLGFIFLLGPSSRCPESQELFRELLSGSPRRLLELLLAGMICGLLWESWNFWAGAKWVYTVPFVGWLKIFEMPLLGFLGFPPFAVECYLMSGCAFYYWDSCGRRESLRERRVMGGILGLALLVFWIFVFAGIDRYTVVSFGA